MARFHARNHRGYGMEKGFSQYKTANTQVSTHIDEKTDLKSLEIAGFTQVFNDKSSRFRRFYWSLIICLALFITGFQIYFRLDNFFNGLPAVVVEFEVRESFKPPRITVCPDIPKRNPELKELVESVFHVDKRTDWNRYFFKLIENKSVEEIWKKSDILHNGLKLEVVEGSSLIRNWQSDMRNLYSIKIASTMGNCHRVYSNNLMKFKGEYTFIRIESPHLEDCDLCKPENAWIHIENDDKNHFSHYFILKYGDKIDLFRFVLMNLLIREITYVNARNKPCTDVSETNKCYEECIDRILFKVEKCPCRLPYMNSSSGVRLCETVDEFRTVLLATERLINALKCKCVPSCKRRLYYLRFSRIVREDKDSILNVAVNFPDNHVEKISEYVSYTFAALISDIGGSLGLYLGISVISALELLEIILFTFITPLCNRLTQKTHHHNKVNHS